MIAAAAGLAEVGPGSPSLDSALGIDIHGPGWALGALGTGALGALAAHLYAESQPAAPAVPEAAPHPQPASQAGGTEQPDPTSQSASAS